MSGKDFRVQIVQASRDKGEARDLIRMIDVLAEERAKARGGPPTSSDYQFSAKFLCILLDPVKPDAYRLAMPKARLRFQGIATDEQVAERFRQAISLEAVKAKDLKSLVEKDPFVILGLEEGKSATLDLEDTQDYRTRD